MHLGTPPCTCKLHPHVPPPLAHQLSQTAVPWPSLSPRGVHTCIMVCLQQDRPGGEAQAGSRIGLGPFGPQRGEVHGLRWTYPLSLADASTERAEWGPSAHRAQCRGLPFPRRRAGLCAHSSASACVSFSQTGFCAGCRPGCWQSSRPPLKQASAALAGLTL